MKKKWLALALAWALALAALLSPALAAEEPHFKDEKEITHLEAVTNLVRLGVWRGKEDGSYFDPKGTVTRGEAAKCVAHILNGGEDVAAPADTSAAPAFPDVKGHWAESWINYCAEKGAAFAQGDGSFDPNGAVTEFELLRMLEVALGEDPGQYAKAENQIGLTHSVALHYGLFTELDDFSGKAILDHELSRDEAAQLFCNALNATPRVRGANGFFEDVKRPDGTPSTLLRESFGYDSWDDVPALPDRAKPAEPKPKALRGIDPTTLTDAKDIQYWEAVASLARLGIVSGRPDGSFDPAGNVTRAEAAKMIAVLMNGGSEANTGAKKEPTFTDIQGHWAEGWIEYCADMHIVSGDGKGHFDPDGNVSVVQFYKMALTALGYDAEAYHLMGASWADQTLERAQHTGGRKLTEGLPNDGLDGTGDDQPASREAAAQILYNALLATPINLSPAGQNDDGTVIWHFHPASPDTDGSRMTLFRQRFTPPEMPALPAQPTT